jgi:hypothetical protein
MYLSSCSSTIEKSSLGPLTSTTLKFGWSPGHRAKKPAWLRQEKHPQFCFDWMLKLVGFLQKLTKLVWIGFHEIRFVRFEILKKFKNLKTKKIKQ